MPETPRPNPALTAQGAEWAQKIIVEANSGRYKEHIYQGYHALTDIFLVNRNRILAEADENDGIDRLTGYGSRGNGIICKNGLFIPASRLLSVTVLDEPIDLPPGSPHGIQLNQKLIVWFGGGGIVTNPWIIDNLDHGVMHNGGGMALLFTPGYSPASVGISETVSTTVDTGGSTESTDFSEHFRIDSDKLDDQRQFTNPTTDASMLFGPAQSSGGLRLSFLTTPLIREGNKIYRDWVKHFEEHSYGTGVDIRSDAVSAESLMRFNKLVAFAHDQIVGQDIIRRQVNSANQIAG